MQQIHPHFSISALLMCRLPSSLDANPGWRSCQLKLMRHTCKLPSPQSSKAASCCLSCHTAHDQYFRGSQPFSEINLVTILIFASSAFLLDAKRRSTYVNTSYNSCASESILIHVS